MCLKVKGRSDLFLKLEIIKKIIISISIFIAIKFGIYGLLYSQALLSFIFFFLNSYNTQKFIDYSWWEQTKDIVPIILAAVLAGLFIFGMDQYLIIYDLVDIFRIIIGISLGVLSYSLIIYLTQRFLFQEIFKIIKKV